VIDGFHFLTVFIYHNEMMVLLFSLIVVFLGIELLKYLTETVPIELAAESRQPLH